jgi:hypothetical protein
MVGHLQHGCHRWERLIDRSEKLLHLFLLNG